MSVEPRRTSKRILLVAIILTVLAGAVGGYLWFQRKRPADPPPGPSLVRLGEFVTNLAGQDSRRFVKIQVDMEVSSPAAAAELMARTSQVRDRVFAVLRSRTVADLAGPEGMRRLADDLITSTNSALTKGSVSAVYFVEFAIQ